MNGVQTFLTISYSILVVVSCVILAIVLRSTRAGRRGPVDHDTLAGNENRWGVVVVILLVTMLAATIWSLPYGEGKAEAGAQVVRVTGQQFGWAVLPGTVRAGKPVEFRLTSKDVQHGFGVFKGHELIFQVQVPAKGENQQIKVHTFDKPGTYEILCMEFCGYQHHMMRGTLKVI